MIVKGGRSQEADHAAPLRILIRTLPLNQSNYGGILQAYALQKVLRDEGHQPWTDSPVELRTNIGAKIWLAKSAFKMRSWDRAISIGMRRRVSSALTAFVRANIATVDLRLDRRRSSRASRAREFNAVIVGSDQVWRPQYTSVLRNFLDFVEIPSTAKISYAASFGIDTLEEYDAELLASARQLLAEFDHVSVREESGLNLCAQMGVTAERHVDPTMLISSEHYRHIAGIEDSPRRSGVSLMLLDEGSVPTEYAVEWADENEQELLRFYPRRLESRRDVRKDRSAYCYRSVEEWLVTVASSSLVVTDSFHVCVFSILFNTPFVAVSNPSRGQTRIDSLLSVFGLEDRSVASKTDAMAAMNAPIDWPRVNRVLEGERQQGLEYLRSALRSEAPAVAG